MSENVKTLLVVILFSLFFIVGIFVGEVIANSRMRCIHYASGYDYCNGVVQ